MPILDLPLILLHLKFHTIFVPLIISQPPVTCTASLQSWISLLMVRGSRHTEPAGTSRTACWEFCPCGLSLPPAPSEWRGGPACDRVGKLVTFKQIISYLRGCRLCVLCLALFLPFICILLLLKHLTLTINIPRLLCFSHLDRTASERQVRLTWASKIRLMLSWTYWRTSSTRGVIFRNSAEIRMDTAVLGSFRWRWREKRRWKLRDDNGLFNAISCVIIL